MDKVERPMSAIDPNEREQYRIDLHGFHLCENAKIEELSEAPEALRFSTPPRQWAYAVQYLIDPPLDGELRIVADLVVHEGEVSLCALDAGENLICEFAVSPRSSAGGRRVVIDPSGCLQRIVFRNVSNKGPSRAELRGLMVGPRALLDSAHERPDGTGVASPVERATTLAIDERIFDEFGRWSGIVPGGYWVDWLGTKTSVDVFVFSEENRQLMLESRFEHPGLPLGEHVLDWVPLLVAARHADARMTTIAVGAGFGRWIVAAAFAASKLGKDYRLVAVEAEPTHFDWLERQLDENLIDREKVRTIQAAAGSESGTCWFQVGNAQGWYGQSIVSPSALPDSVTDSGCAGVDVDDYRVVPVKCVDLDEVIGELEHVDYLHMDIQGAEYDFLSGNPDLLNARVGMVNVGTHSTSIEEDLRSMFGELGWVSMWDVQIGSEVVLAPYRSFGAAEPRSERFGDGAQVWMNPWL